MIGPPMDAEGRGIPLDTEAPYGKDGAPCSLDGPGPGTGARPAGPIEGRDR